MIYVIYESLRSFANNSGYSPKLPVKIFYQIKKYGSCLFDEIMVWFCFKYDTIYSIWIFLQISLKKSSENQRIPCIEFAFNTTLALVHNPGFFSIKLGNAKAKLKEHKQYNYEDYTFRYGFLVLGDHH